MLNFSDTLVEIMRKVIDVKEYETISTVDDTCFVDIPENEIKLENTEIPGNLKKKGGGCLCC